MNHSLLGFIATTHQTVAYYNLWQLQQQFTINPKENLADIARFPEPSEIDLYVLPDKLRQLVRLYIRLMRSIHVQREIDTAFENFLTFMGDFNRVAEVSWNWICPALISSSNELLLVYQVRSKSKTKEENDESLEKVATIINRLFKICLTDKSVDPATSKKLCIHFFLATLIKIYFKLDHIELAKLMEKALMGTNSAIPTIINCPVQYRKHVVTYLYYSALLSLDDAEYALAEVKLLTAWDFLLCYNRPQKVQPHLEKILMIVAPLKYLSSRKRLSDALYEKYPNLKYIYKEQLLKSVNEGNLAAFDEQLQKFHIVLLNRHIYLLVLRLKQLCYLLLVRKTATFYKTVNDKTPHIVPLAYFQKALDFAQKGSDPSKEEASVEQVECILANLIAQKHIKGYISHANRCIVLLKSDAFPKPAPLN